MKGFLSLELRNAGTDPTLRELESCNQVSGRFGLSLRPEQMARLEAERVTALRDTGLVEFGGGILKKLVYEFCDSPYISQKNYEESLAGLQELFYYFKKETGGRMSDDELVERMGRAFNRKAQGSIPYLAGMDMEEDEELGREGDDDEG